MCLPDLPYTPFIHKIEKVVLETKKPYKLLFCVKAQICNATDGHIRKTITSVELYLGALDIKEIKFLK
jgi:hypothetical protein